jgi:tetratricopeptide (TPR) repeat protein
MSDSCGSKDGWEPRANALFLSAVDLPPGEARESYLDRVCGDDARLRTEVESLLRASERAACFLESSVVTSVTNATPFARVGPQIGDYVGRYRLVELLGEGGMGLVYRAEQSEPVRRSVAVKIIKPGLDTQQVLARFAAERQALTLMDHPHIARAIDAGSTSDGRPYFVMDLLQGAPITAFCDQRWMTLHERLRLFIPICLAVQHAHQKGVIHRDLKPSNVLVVEHEDRPVAKVIDFGVAKAAGPRLAEQALSTACGLLVGTLEYMSPEQASLGSIDVDARCDVYALGALLYELVTGFPPLCAERARTVSFDEARRLIQQETPQRPSDRLIRSVALAAPAAQCAPNCLQWADQVRGDLDWIVMKALEKDRERRYQTANALARDLERYLADEPVEARPPSAAYRIRKFARRHRWPVATAALAAVALCVGTSVSAWLAVRATRAETEALAQAAEARRAVAAERQAKIAEATQRVLAEDRLKLLLLSAGIANFKLTDSDLPRVIDGLGDQLDSLFQNDARLKTQFHLHMGRTLLDMRRFPEAVGQLRRCIASTDDAAIVDLASIQLADALRRLGAMEEATDILEKLLRDRLPEIDAPGVEELHAAWSELPRAAELVVETPGQDALELDGVDDYIVVPQLQFDGRPPWTLEALINPAELNQFAGRSTSRWTSLISTTDGGGIGLECNRGKWALGLYASVVPEDPGRNDYPMAEASESASLRRWQHLAGVWDGAELRLYIDGQAVAVRPGVNDCSVLSSYPFFIGADPCDPYFGYVAEGLFKGRIRAVRISRGVEYAQPFAPLERLAATPTTAALFDFTIDTGRYALDRSGHGRHAIIVGARFVPAEP